MPALTHRGSAGGKAVKEEVYTIMIVGVPHNHDWQELKDFLRQLGASHLRQAAVHPNDDGSHIGTCAIVGKNDAYHVYDELINRGWNGKPIEIGLARDHSHGAGYQQCRGPERSRCRHPVTSIVSQRQYVPTQSLNRAAAGETITPIGQRTNSSFQMTPYSGSIIHTPNTHSHQPNFQYPKSYGLLSQPIEPHPHFFGAVTYPNTNRSGIASHSGHANASHPRSIVITMLSFDTTARQLQAILQTYGEVERCLVYRKSGRYSGGSRKRCSARARFFRSIDAVRACDELQNKLVDSRCIQVKLDHDDKQESNASPSSVWYATSTSTDVRAPIQTETKKSSPRNRGPLVVNGATGTNDRRAGHRTSRDSSSDNDSEDSETDSED